MPPVLARKLPEGGAWRLRGVLLDVEHLVVRGGATVAVLGRLGSVGAGRDGNARGTREARGAERATAERARRLRGKQGGGGDGGGIGGRVRQRGSRGGARGASRRRGFLAFQTRARFTRLSGRSRAGARAHLETRRPRVCVHRDGSHRRSVRGKAETFAPFARARSCAEITSIQGLASSRRPTAHGHGGQRSKSASGKPEPCSGSAPARRFSFVAGLHPSSPVGFERPVHRRKKLDRSF